ncbi:sulfatase-like hydrolase/transferase [Coraliomargarita sp. SDUM461004]|uniref:Sulfatase-like hydrolase/transferase n=1 Tax=Thalassobacterium sedimentorum TaxID=3041258 RepID=A0ABU1AG23_9BACT|nr:sulfatase-like hydrolase/transferase [Coraliomargarita sp. SDUM461004]MDQ8193772.1 sulfatase-like hydrolase/transferase [Coraliomargarita sp. SDUM461004]
MKLYFFLLFSVLSVCTAETPNIVFLLTDDLGYGDLGSYGSENETPNIDQLARDGIRYTNFYVNAPACSAARAGFLTGTYHRRNRAQSVYNPDLNEEKHRGLSLGEITIAELLKTRGYTSACIGKWHLGDHPHFHPQAQGFDYFYGLPYSHDMWPEHPTREFPPLRLIQNDTIINHNIVENDQRKMIDALTQEAIDFVSENKKAPFFLYLPYPAPHTPLLPDQRYLGKTEKGLYADTLLAIDESVGQVIAHLKESGLEDNTIVIFSSDNGPWRMYGTHGGSSGGLREGKATCWEGGIKVPLIVKWPKHIQANTSFEQPVINLDILPTIADIVDYDIKEIPHKIDGWSILDTFYGKENFDLERRPLVFYYRSQLRGLRLGDWKLMPKQTYFSMNPPEKEPDNRGAPGVYNRVAMEDQLFDLSKDPNELNNVIEQYPGIYRDLTKIANHYRQQLGDITTGDKGTQRRGGENYIEE